MQHQFDTSSLGIEGLGWCAVSTGHIQPPSTGRKGQLHFTISIQYLLAIIHSEGFITQSCGFRLRISFANESGHWRSHSLLRQHTPTRQSWQPASMPGSLEPTHNLEGPSSPPPPGHLRPGGDSTAIPVFPSEILYVCLFAGKPI